MVNRQPQLELIAPSASPEETAAIMGALGRFMRDTAPAPGIPESQPDRWKRVAILEGVQREDALTEEWAAEEPRLEMP
ncbi:MAG TPA: hypothetical protein VGF15_02090 [Solirubrobacteraceae bacterium]|jgi:hypothetical protein